MVSARVKALLMAAFALAGALLGAGSSLASTAPRVEAARFEIRASNGFVASVDAGAGRVHLTLTRRRKHRGEIVQYAADAEVSTLGIKAELGSLGVIDVSFGPTGEVEGLAPPAGCDGAYVKGKAGTFTGEIRFRGEEGYAEIDAGRAKGEVGASSRWDCDRGNAAARPAGRGLRRVSQEEREEAAQERGYGHLSASLPGKRFFRAVGGPAAAGRFGPAFFAAAAFERSGSLEIGREVAIEDFRKGFRFEEDLGAAAVSPGAPFAGTARFRRDTAGATHWSGSLSVSLPGLADVPLVGPGFKAQLSHDLPGD